MSPSLEEAAAELYAVEPGRFTAERTRLTKEARQAKDTEAAKAIGELRRPTTSAWLLNQLVRGEQGAGEEIDRLEQLGHDLREAQAALDAQLMRELTKERHQLVAALVQRAEEIAEQAGQKVGAAVRRELEDTLGAAVADEQASLAVTSGRLTRALTYAGFGEVDVTEATATPLSAVHPYKARRSDTSGKPLPASASSKAETAGGESGTVGDESGTAGTGTGTAGSGPQNAPTMKRRDSKLAPAHPKSSPDDDTDSTGTSSRAHSRPAGKPENPEKPRQSPQEARQPSSRPAAPRPRNWSAEPAPTSKQPNSRYARANRNSTQPPPNRPTSRPGSTNSRPRSSSCAENSTPATDGSRTPNAT